MHENNLTGNISNVDEFIKFVSAYNRLMGHPVKKLEPIIGNFLI